MDISVDYKDENGNYHQQTHSISKIGLIKHLAIAGLGYAPAPHKLMKAIGMGLHYSLYLQSNALRSDHFSLPPIGLSDPTEQGQFSNLAGRAIADFLSKKISNSQFTVGYEAAMRKLKILIKGKRPDLIAFSTNATFAIEAKGRHEATSGSMIKHKRQAMAGPIPVQFSIASVSYNLFRQVKCKYYDPRNDDVPFDIELLQELSKDYYAGLLEFLDNDNFYVQEIEVNGEKFLEISIKPNLFRKIIPWRIDPFWHEIYYHHYPRLILPAHIKELAENGINSQTPSFEIVQEEYRYIDKDRVGLSFHL